MANKYTGDVVVHCHIVPDADLGMMMTTQEKGRCCGKGRESAVRGEVGFS